MKIIRLSVMQTMVRALFFVLIGSIPATVSAYGYYDYRVKNYQYEYDLRPLKRLNLHPWTEGGPGASIYYDTGNMGGDWAPNWDYHWSWFPLMDLGYGRYFGLKRSFIKGKGEFLEKVWLQKYGSGLLYIQYSLIAARTNRETNAGDVHLGTKNEIMYLYDQKWW